MNDNKLKTKFRLLKSLSDNEFDMVNKITFQWLNKTYTGLNLIVFQIFISCSHYL